MSTITRADDSAWPDPRYAWYVVAMLVLAYTFAILDRSVISLLVQPIKADFGVTDAEIGLLQGLAFAICYTTFGMVLGVITDRANRRLILVAGITVWSLSTILCGFAPNFRMLFLARIGVGLGEACILPVAGSIISDYFSPLRRPKAYGIFLLGGTLGTTAGYVLGAVAIITADAVRAAVPGLLGDLHNWQVTFFLAGVPGLMVALLIFATVREPVRREKIATDGPPQLGPLFQHLRINARAYFTLLAGTVLNVTGIYAQISWAATLFIRVHGWSPVDVGNTLAVLSVFGGMSSILLAFSGRDISLFIIFESYFC